MVEQRLEGLESAQAGGLRQGLEDGKGLTAGSGLAALRNFSGDDRWTQRALSGIIGRLNGRITQEAQQVAALVMLDQTLLEAEIFLGTTGLIETRLDLRGECRSLTPIFQQRAVPLMKALMQLKRCVEVHQQLLRVRPTPPSLLKLHVQRLLA